MKNDSEMFVCSQQLIHYREYAYSKKIILFSANDEYKCICVSDNFDTPCIIIIINNKTTIYKAQ